MPPSPYFFLSYARDDMPAQLRFYDDLAGAIRDQENGLTLEDIGFRDVQSIPIGTSWSAELGQALQSCGAFIYLQSPTYWTRAWCGKEWHAFRSRLESLPTPPPLMFPVLWVTRGAPPPAAAHIQFTHEALGENYAKYGLKMLMQVSKFQDDYRLFLFNFARRVVDAVQADPLAPAAQAPEFDKVPNAFLPPPLAHAEAGTAPAATFVGPRHALFVYVVGRRAELQPLRRRLDAYGDEELDWKPYLPLGNDPVYVLAQRVAADEKLHYERLPLGGNLVEKLREAEDAGKIVVLLVDTWSLQLDPYQRLMHDYDMLRFRNCVVLVPWNPQDDEAASRADQLETLLRRTFNRQSGTVYRTQIQSAEQLREELIRALNEGRTNIIQYSKDVPRPAQGEGLHAKPTIHAVRGA